MLYAFEDFTLDANRRELRKAGALLAVEPQVLDLIMYLISNRERVVSKNDLLAAIWQGRIVSDSTLDGRINLARRAVGDDGTAQRLIRTIPRKGFRFLGSVQEHRHVAGQASATEPRQGADMHRPETELPSLAVLPFINLSDDPQQEYFADGIVEEIITGLSRSRSLFVIARNSTFVFKNQAADIKDVGSKLGVRYILEGSVRKAESRVRITCQLIDTETAAHVWAERYDRPLADIFAVQDEISLSVIGALEPTIRQAEIARVKRKRPDQLEAYDLVLRALAMVSGSMMAEDATRALPLLRDALRLEPDYADAHALLAWAHQILYRERGRQQQDLRAAIHHAHLAMAHGYDNITALAMGAYVTAMAEHDRTTAFATFERALMLGPSSALTLFLGSVALAWAGEAERAIEWAERALRFSPFDPLNAFALGALAIAHFQRGRCEEALGFANRAVQSNPRFGLLRFLQTAALVKLGRLEEARRAAAAGLELQPSFRIREAMSALALPGALALPLEESWRTVGLPR